MEKDSGNAERKNWTRKIEFVLSSVSVAVGTGNVWRFPYLCYKNGGGAFFIPYILFALLAAVPMYIVEIGLGQYMQRGGYEAWNIAPLFKGIGLASLVIMLIINVYYSSVMTWSLFYFGMSLTSELPWSHCHNEWNTERCHVGVLSTRNTSVMANMTSLNSSAFNHSYPNHTKMVDSTEEFWRYKTLQMSDGIEHLDGVVWELAVCCFVVWIIVYFSLWRGIQWTGKVVYVTAIFPFLVITILLIRGVTLPGASEGIKYYLKPDFSKLLKYQVWVDGGTQIIFSIGISFGSLVVIGSYNKFHYDFYKSSLVVMAVNSFTSVYAGFTVFSVLGFMAYTQQVSVDEVVNKGPGLAFITYPKAVAQMPFPPVWSSLFFLMLFVVGIGTQIFGVEAFTTPLMDVFPSMLRVPKRQTIFKLVYCSATFLVCLILTTRGGIYVFSLLDYYAVSGMMLVWQLLCEAVVVGYIFGADRFYDALELMIGYRLWPWLKYCVKYTVPVLLVLLIILQAINFKGLTFEDGYEYPTWAHAIGGILAIIPMMCMPAVCIWQMCTTSGSLRERYKKNTEPLLKPIQLHPSWKGTPLFNNYAME